MHRPSKRLIYDVRHISKWCISDGGFIVRETSTYGSKLNLVDIADFKLLQGQSATCQYIYIQYMPNTNGMGTILENIILLVISK